MCVPLCDEDRLMCKPDVNLESKRVEAIRLSMKKPENNLSARDFAQNQYGLNQMLLHFIIETKSW